MNTTSCINRSGSCTARFVFHCVTPKGLLSFCHCESNFQIPESSAGETAAEWWGKEKRCGGRGGRGDTSDKLRHGGMRYQAPALSCLFPPNAACGKKQQCIQEIRTAWEALGDVLEQTQLSPAESCQSQYNFSFKLSHKWLRTQSFCPHLFI